MVVFLISVWAGFDGTLVLKTGKTVDYVGEYQVNGRFLVFENPVGELIQLPAKMVDLKKSQTLMARKLKAMELEEKKRIAAEREARKTIADFVEAEGAPDSGQVQIGDDGLEQFLDSGSSGNDYDSASTNKRRPTSRSQMNASSYEIRLASLHRQLKQIKVRIGKAKQKRRTVKAGNGRTRYGPYDTRNNRYYNDKPKVRNRGDSAYVKSLERQRDSILAQIQNLRKQAQ